MHRFFKEANAAFAKSDYQLALELYVALQKRYPKLERIVSTNIAITRKRLAQVIAKDHISTTVQEAAAGKLSSNTAYEIFRCAKKKLIHRWISESVSSQRAIRERRAPINPVKVMVGTLFSGENEFEECRKSIQNQSYTNLEHKIISNQPKKQAHSQLFGDFFRSDAQLLLKVDADMVILDPHLIAKLVEIYLSNPDIHIWQFAILDYYTGSEIQGINLFSRQLIWSEDRQDDLFTDRSQSPSSKRRVLWPNFVNSVLHSPNPSEFQAFHFGVHRALKVYTSASLGQMEKAEEQLMYLERCYKHYTIRRERQLLFACLGAEMALRGIFDIEHVDYTNPKLETIFSTIKASKTYFELRDQLVRERTSPVPNPYVSDLLKDREKYQELPSVRKLLILLPHLKLYGGVNRFLEIAQQARLQGVFTVICTPQSNDSQRRCALEQFPLLEFMTFQEATDTIWSIVLCGDYSSGIMVSMPWFKSDLKVIYILNGEQYRYLNDVQISLSAPDVVIANSSYVADVYRHWAPVVVAGAIDHSIFFPKSDANLRNIKSILKVVSPGGRNKPSKRFGDAVTACELLQAEGVAVELHVFSAELLDVKSSVQIVQHVSLDRKGVADLMRSCDIALCPEIDAGWNNPAAEAMACGIPLICTKGGTSDFAFDGETALVVEDANIQGFFKALKLLSQDPLRAQTLAASGREIITRFTWSSLTRSLLEIFEWSRPNSLRRTAIDEKCKSKIRKALKNVSN